MCFFFLFQNEKGFLGYTDVSMGTRVAGICTGLGRLDVMTQNPSNAIIMMGHASGKVKVTVFLALFE
jgi:U3 small nucleolar RNA-associated protein 7